MSGFIKPTLSELIDRSRNDLNGRMTGADSFLRRALVNALAIVWGGLLFMLYGYLDRMADEMMPDKADAWLPRHASIWKIQAKVATFATGPVTLTGTIDTPVDAGTVFQRLDGLRYQTTEDAVFTGTTLVVTVTALASGSASNAIAGTRLNFVSPISGVSSEAVVATGGLIGGADNEGKASQQARIKARISDTPQGGSEADYKAWVKEVYPDARVWVYKGWAGAGTVGISFVIDSREDIIPTTDEVDAVEAYLEIKRPVTADLWVFAPIPDVFTPTISLTPNTDIVKTAVTAQLSEFIRVNAVPGGTETLSQINEAISLAAGETDHDLVSPVAPVTHAPGHIAVMGVPVWV